MATPPRDFSQTHHELRCGDEECEQTKYYERCTAEASRFVWSTLCIEHIPSGLIIRNRRSILKNDKGLSNGYMYSVATHGLINSQPEGQQSCAQKSLLTTHLQFYSFTFFSQHLSMWI
ncbi:hypothetical protein OCU04_005637 [Sclerotinia nivalis]|uniref:Uncharacterized protein n=1 Tax=Sclerotinia nivalis TaxID=352851 RepID=A0A9X0DKQ5_9HELO|nr:hypothetical protein OCU04_005637 [Sclerotinia nivalis]